MQALTELLVLDLLLDLFKHGWVVFLEPLVVLGGRGEESEFGVSIRYLDLA
jgi:hypothetical protein